MFGEQLNVRLIENNENTLNAFELISEPNGVIQLTINPPKGIVDFVEQSIRFEAVDSAGEKISTDWFTIMLKPIAELTQLTRGLNQRPLDQVELGNSQHKNAVINVSNLLDINAIKLIDYQGDDAIIKLKVPFIDASLEFKGISNSNIIRKTIDAEIVNSVLI